MDIFQSFGSVHIFPLLENVLMIDLSSFFFREDIGIIAILFY